MNKKFSNVPLDPGTMVIEEKHTKLQNLDAFYQKWFWDGITAESIIFTNQDIIDLDDNAVMDIVRKSAYFDLNSHLTFKRSENGFTFTSFNFKT